jgi:hypothetical protein
MSAAGSIESVSIDSRGFAVAADADSNRKLGGFENEMQPNGNGTVRQIKTRVPWNLDGIALSLDDANDDQQFLQDRADAFNEVAISITYANGETYSGSGNVTGEVQGSSQNGTATVSLSGSKRLARQ